MFHCVYPWSWRFIVIIFGIVDRIRTILKVSNELLESAFSQFGNVERAVVIVDDRGRSTGRGIIEFARKASATKALQQISVNAAAFNFYFRICIRV